MPDPVTEYHQKKMELIRWEERLQEQEERLLEREQHIHDRDESLRRREKRISRVGVWSATFAAIIASIIGYGLGTLQV